MPKTKNVDVQSIEQLTSRFRKLDTEKTRVQTMLDTTSQRLQELLAEAEEKFGTRDLDELKSKLKQLESENLEMKQHYQQQLESIEGKLATMDGDINETESSDD